MQHFHVERATTDKLAEVLDEAAENDDTIEVTYHFTGGRDWVVVARHADHDDTRSDEERGPRVLSRRQTHAVFHDGVAAGERTLVYYEPPDRSWIVWADADGRPELYWPRRDAGGGVLGGSVVLTPGPTDLEEAAWGLIANAGGGHWNRESDEWREAAVRWREQYHEKLGAPVPPPAPHQCLPRAHRHDESGEAVPI